MNITEIFAKNLRGQDYIQSRGLSPDAIKNEGHDCPSCKRMEMLPAVLRLIESWRK